MPKPKFPAITVFVGNETHLLDRERDKACSWPDREVAILDGKETSESALLAALQDVPLDGTGTVVVVDYAERVKLSKAFTQYWQDRGPADRSSVLVALLRTARPSKAWVEFAGLGRCIHHMQCKPWDHEGIEKKILAEAKAQGLVLEEGALSLLFRAYGENVGAAVNELRKLAFLGQSGKVTKDHVKLVCSLPIPVKPWDVANAACLKAKKKALGLAAMLFKHEGDAAASVILVSALMRNVEKLILAKNLSDRGKGSKAVASALGLNPFIYEGTYAPMLRLHSQESLKIQMQRLCELETQVKGSSNSKRTLVELAILSLVE